MKSLNFSVCALRRERGAFLLGREGSWKNKSKWVASSVIKQMPQGLCEAVPCNRYRMGGQAGGLADAACGSQPVECVGANEQSLENIYHPTKYMHAGQDIDY